MTQRELAEGICSHSFVSKIEKGHAMPTLGILEAFAERLGVTLPDLYGPAKRTIPPEWVVEAISEIVEALECDDHTRALHRALMALGRGLELTGDRDGALVVYRKAAEVTTPQNPHRSSRREGQVASAPYTNAAPLPVRTSAIHNPSPRPADAGAVGQ